MENQKFPENFGKRFGKKAFTPLVKVVYMTYPKVATRLAISPCWGGGKISILNALLRYEIIILCWIGHDSTIKPSLLKELD